MKIKVFTLNSFAKTPAGGNPAGVVLEADGLSEKQMMFISKKVGFSETAFVQKSDKADYKVRFFTPVDEVNLCGHATIATYYLMWKKRQAKNGFLKQETKAGILGIEITEGGTIFMNQIPPQYYGELDKNQIAESLNIPVNYLDEELPVEIVSTGLKDIIVPLKSMGYLFLVKPNLQRINEISKQYKVIGYHIFTSETKFNSTAHCRNFAPLYGVPEESATGTATGALSCYLFKHGKINRTQVDKLLFEQGYSMNRPSEVLAKLLVSDDEIKEVKVGGKAIIAKELEIEV